MESEQNLVGRIVELDHVRHFADDHHVGLPADRLTGEPSLHNSSRIWI